MKHVALAERRDLKDYKVCRCSLDPTVLGLDGFVVGDYYLFLAYDTVTTVFLPRLDYIQRLTTAEVREAGTIKQLDFRAFFVTSGRTGEDYA